MLDSLERFVLGLRERRWANLGVALARIFLAFAFVPAGLKKVLGQPFTDPAKTGAFHDFLHAFHATGAFYSFVGVVQLSAAFLLLSQRYATAGAALLLPVLTAIFVFCWSTGVYPTATVVTIMWITTLGLFAWDLDKWRVLLAAEGATRSSPPRSRPPLDLRLWAACGLTVTALYLGVCLASAEIYRPRGAEFGKPAFYVFPLMLALVGATFGVDEVRHRRRPRQATPGSGEEVL
ncbi:MAG: hypothetical protein JKY65_30790 [Planctomycetes bacterium]|nr:hypothetical protein [Planctomycetota bacterium]